MQKLSNGLRVPEFGDYIGYVLFNNFYEFPAGPKFLLFLAGEANLAPAVILNVPYFSSNTTA